MGYWGMGIGLFLVVRVNERWWIDFEGQAHGPLDTRDAATAKAHELAAAARRFGRTAEVMVPDDAEHHWHVVTPKAPKRTSSRRAT